MSDETRETGQKPARATRLTLLCRGATAANRLSRLSCDEPLLARERERAERLAPLLPAVDAVFCAPETSARETAALLGLPPTIAEPLRDMDYGRWSGLALEDIAAQNPRDLQHWLSDPAAAPHGGESFEAARTRCTTWLDGRHAAGGHLLAITHATVLKLMLAHVLNAPLQAIWRTDVEPLGALTLTSNGQRWALRFFGSPLAFG
ncbi:histidine phosphatase family protein [Shinella zoogloeoides]|uniref:Histidine phosphatase family protein n=1 Tax=Shinella zoogloeoides TaxID=352475 RepID=A0A6N8TI31_SHIZO|nr:histidine phosphatase family protein [Shinella zoogloeoides]MXO02599.1 histidine phosphatase family protein [Shinella zoogloeoides]UEX82253.1 histidine phosphatase family protein [Shinella zoogloeoides]